MNLMHSTPTICAETRLCSSAYVEQLVWVGGAMDQYTQLLKQYVGAGQPYFQWFEGQALSKWLRQQPKFSVRLIGHSYGASTAAHLVAQGHPVAELITLDPVGWRKPNPRQIQQYCYAWQNYYAASRQLNFANLVAACGGQWRNWPLNHAHLHRAVPVDHAQVVSAVITGFAENLTIK